VLASTAVIVGIAWWVLRSPVGKLLLARGTMRPGCGRPGIRSRGISGSPMWRRARWPGSAAC
jgi:hypothetical protein